MVFIQSVLIPLIVSGLVSVYSREIHGLLDRIFRRVRQIPRNRFQQELWLLEHLNGSAYNLLLWFLTELLEAVWLMIYVYLGYGVYLLLAILVWHIKPDIYLSPMLIGVLIGRAVYMRPILLGLMKYDERTADLRSTLQTLQHIPQG
jgi:hypothetical protein